MRTPSQNKSKFQCMECAKKFSSKQYLAKHLIKDHNYSEKQAKNSVGGFRQYATPKPNQTNKMFVCTICGFEMPHKGAMVLHYLSSHKGIKQRQITDKNREIALQELGLKCKICNRKTHGIDDLINHFITAHMEINKNSITNNHRKIARNELSITQNKSINQMMLEVHDILKNTPNAMSNTMTITNELMRNLNVVINFPNVQRVIQESNQRNRTPTNSNQPGIEGKECPLCFDKIKDKQQMFKHLMGSKHELSEQEARNIINYKKISNFKLQNNPQTCKLCGKSITYSKMLKHLMSKKHSLSEKEAREMTGRKKRYINGYNSERTRNGYVRRNWHKVYKCSICDLEFANIHRLISHLQSKHGFSEIGAYRKVENNYQISIKTTGDKHENN